MNTRRCRTYSIYSRVHPPRTLTNRLADVDYAPGFWKYTVTARSIRQAFYLTRNLIWSATPGEVGINAVEQDRWKFDWIDLNWYRDLRSDTEREQAGLLMKSAR